MRVRRKWTRASVEGGRRAPLVPWIGATTLGWSVAWLAGHLVLVLIVAGEAYLSILFRDEVVILLARAVGFSVAIVLAAILMGYLMARIQGRALPPTYRRPGRWLVANVVGCAVLVVAVYGPTTTLNLLPAPSDLLARVAYTGLAYTGVGLCQGYAFGRGWVVGLGWCAAVTAGGIASTLPNVLLLIITSGGSLRAVAGAATILSGTGLIQGLCIGVATGLLLRPLMSSHSTELRANEGNV